MAHFGLRLGCWQRDCSATNGGPPELEHSNKGTGSSIRVDALWVKPFPRPLNLFLARTFKMRAIRVTSPLHNIPYANLESRSLQGYTPVAN